MSEEWISAAETYRLVRAVMSSYETPRAICARAYAGLIQAKAVRLKLGNETRDDAVVPKEFWWASGEAALDQNWSTGDFETWIDRRHQFQAFGVSFSKRGIDELIGPALAAREIKPNQVVNAGGRPPASWWDDLWVEMCRQLYEGDLQPSRQADIESAMVSWASANGHDPAESTIRQRARKLWFALSKEGEN